MDPLVGIAVVRNGVTNLGLDRRTVDVTPSPILRGPVEGVLIALLLVLPEYVFVVVIRGFLSGVEG